MVVDWVAVVVAAGSVADVVVKDSAEDSEEAAGYGNLGAAMCRPGLHDSREWVHKRPRR